MTPLIRNRQQVANDEWQLVADDAALPADGKHIVSLQRWQAESATLGQAVGVLIPNSIDVNSLWPQVAALPLLALQFPAFGDGRAYSQARVLRRLGYTGEIRALGAVARDMIREMHRCGFDSMVPRESEDLQDCIKAFGDFSLAYQNSADDQTPVIQLRQA